MAHRGGPSWPGRGHRPYRPDNSSNYGPFPGRGGNRAAVGPRGFRGPPMPIHRPRPPPPTTTPLSPPHPPVVSYRHRGDELSAGSGREGILHREQYDYGHGRDRSRSPYASRESQYGTKVVLSRCSVVFWNCVAFCLDRILFEKLAELEISYLLINVDIQFDSPVIFSYRMELHNLLYWQ